MKIKNGNNSTEIVMAVRESSTLLAKNEKLKCGIIVENRITIKHRNSKIYVHFSCA